MNEYSLENLLKDAPQAAPPVEEAAVAEAVNAQFESLPAVREEEVQKVMKDIDLRDSAATNLYGVGTQKSIAQFSDSILSQVRSRDAGEVGALMTDLLVRVKNVNEPDKPNFFEKIFGGVKGEIQRYLASYDDLSQQIDAIAARLQMQEKTLLQNIEVFDRLYQENLDYFHDLEVYIVAGEEKVREMREEVLPSLEAQAKASDHAMAAQVVKDLAANVDRFEKKVHDLKISQTLALQTAPQIKLIQNNDQLLATKISDAIHNTIPLWKSQTVMALGLAEQEQALKLQRDVSETTNELIRRNAENLKQTTLGVQEEAQRSIVDIETLEAANRDLIETIEGSIAINKKAKETRRAAEEKMVQIQGDLKSALIRALETGEQ
ncbi:uncharacterized protein YaaN involved in tellurite resistance [Peptoniphilus ivorii]|uniref:toxic anion resistance protein n=1 Tax=Aedoeadaptatus ivorii TaxID=54006 RepID=UPI00278439C8|nr:toxic anion resistance protein [Peptoniphilus ivorii]MDQ0508373.1 uncharacterized protein YaaN involved in tellurite resistance [Peptoniphilus ivorii]